MFVWETARTNMRDNGMNFNLWDFSVKDNKMSLTD